MHYGVHMSLQCVSGEQLNVIGPNPGALERPMARLAWRIQGERHHRADAIGGMRQEFGKHRRHVPRVRHSCHGEGGDLEPAIVPQREEGPILKQQGIRHCASSTTIRQKHGLVSHADSLTIQAIVVHGSAWRQPSTMLQTGYRIHSLGLEEGVTPCPP
jgi:hypothetical protein